MTVEEAARLPRGQRLIDTMAATTWDNNTITVGSPTTSTYTNAALIGR